MKDKQIASNQGWLRCTLLDMKNIFSNNYLKHPSVQSFKTELKVALHSV